MTTKTLYKIDNNGNYLGLEIIETKNSKVYSLIGTKPITYESGIVVVNFLFTEQQPPTISGTQTLKYVNNTWTVEDGPEEIKQKEQERLREEELQKQKELEEQERLRQEELQRQEEERQRQEAEQQKQREEEQKKQEELQRLEDEKNKILKELQQIDQQLNT